MRRFIRSTGDSGLRVLPVKNTTVAHGGAFGVAQAQVSDRARPAHPVGAGELHRLVALDHHRAAALVEKLPGRADANLVFLVVMEVLRPEQALLLCASRLVVEQRRALAHPLE